MCICSIGHCETVICLLTRKKWHLLGWTSPKVEIFQKSPKLHKPHSHLPEFGSHSPLNPSKILFKLHETDRPKEEQLATILRPGFPFPLPTDPGCKHRCHHCPAECLIKLCIDAFCRIPSLCWLLIQFPTGLLHLAAELTAATLLGWHGSMFFLCTEPSPCGSSDEIVSAYAYRKSRDFVNKTARGIPRKTAQQDYTEIFSLSISVKIFEQENPVYTTGSSQGLSFLYKETLMF